jgi:hypothetical protein
MIKLVLAIFAVALSSLALAEPLLMHMGGKGSVQEKEMQALGKQLQANGIRTEYFAPGNCVEPARLWNQAGARPAILHYSTTYANAELKDGKPCTANLAGAHIVISKPTPNWLCGPTNPKPFNTPGLRMGLYSTAPGRDAVADINRLNGFAWRHIPIASTTDGLVAVANGDIDYFLVARAGVGNRIETAQLKCMASTVRNDRFPYLGTFFKTTGDLETALTPTHVIMAKNLSVDSLALLQRLLDPDQNPEFRAMLQFQNAQTEPVKNNQQALNDFQRRVKMLLETYKQ